MNNEKREKRSEIKSFMQEKKKKMEEWLWLACKDGNAEEVITLLQNEQIDY